MEAKTQKSGSPFEAFLNEAKVYKSMGLYEEARDVYVRILSTFPDLPPHSSELLQGHIDQLNQEITERNGEDAEAILTDEAISLIRQEFSETDASVDPHDRAVVFMETGQYTEAMEEFLRLLKTQTPLERFLGHLVDCVLRLHGPEKAPAFIEELGKELSLGKRERAQLAFKLGDALEKDERIDAAIDLYRSARRIIPEDLNMRSALDAKLAGLSKDSRYAYLLNQGWIRQEDLEQAEKQAKTSPGPGVDAILMDACGVGKEDLGTSLSVYCGVPFRTYDPNAMTPVELITCLDRATLEKEGWVPVASYGNEVDVLMEYPDDSETVQRLREALNTGDVNLSVGVRQDIMSYIDRFFREAGVAAGRAEPETPAVPARPRKTRRERRYAPSIPDFVYVEFTLDAEAGKPRHCRLDVLNCSEGGIGLLVPKGEADLLNALKVGKVIPDVTFYAPWTLIQADAKVRHMTPIPTGRHAGDYMLGVESAEIIESSRIPD